MEPEFRKVFPPRRARSVFSFRRKSDLVLFLGSLAMFSLGLTAFGAVFYMVQSKDPPAAVVTPEPTPPPPSIFRRAQPKPQPVLDPEPEIEPPSAPAAIVEEPVVKKAAKPAAPARLLAAPFVLFQAGAEAPRGSADDSAEVQVDRITVDGQRALQISYRLQRGAWVRATYSRRLNLAGAKRLQLFFRGEGAYNTFEVSIQDTDGTIASVAWPNRTGVKAWTAADVPLDTLAVWGGDGMMDWGNVRMIFFRVSKAPKDQGGDGRVVVRGFRIL